MARYDYHRPRTLEDASRLRACIEGSRYIAGGTDVMVQLRNRRLRPSALISLRSIAELDGIEAGDEIRVGATTRIADLVSHPVLREKVPLLCDAAGHLGSEQIRNAATIGGNLCNASPCADTALPLLVLDARVRIWSGGRTRDIPLEQLFVGPGQTCLEPGEILHGILLPMPTPATRATFLKKGRVAMDLAIASVAAALEVQGRSFAKARFAAGSVAPVPLRLREVEALLETREATPALAAEARRVAERSVRPITDVRSTAEYRRHLVGVYVERAIMTLALGAAP